MFHNNHIWSRWLPGLWQPCSWRSGGWSGTSPQSLPGNTHLTLFLVVHSLTQTDRLRPQTHKLTESRYTMTFPGSVSTFLTMSLVWIPSGDKKKPLSSPTSMRAIPVAFRDRPLTRLPRRDNKQKHHPLESPNDISEVVTRTTVHRLSSTLLIRKCLQVLHKYQQNPAEWNTQYPQPATWAKISAVLKWRYSKAEIRPGADDQVSSMWVQVKQLHTQMEGLGFVCVSPFPH